MSAVVNNNKPLSKQQQPGAGGRHALFLCVFTLVIVPLTFLSLATAVSCRDRLTTTLLLLAPRAASSSSSLSSVAASTAGAAAAAPDGADLEAQQRIGGGETAAAVPPPNASKRASEAGDVGSGSSRATPNNNNNNNNRCTLNDYLKGEWQPTAEPQVRSGYNFCTIDPRQDCRAYASSKSSSASTYLHQKWVPKDPRCPLRQLTPQQVKRCLRNESIVFLGDSLARNHQQSLQCMLLEEPEQPVAARPFLKVRTSSVIPPSDIAKFLVANDNDTTIVIVGTGSHWNPYAFGFDNLSYTSQWSEIPGGNEEGKRIVRASIKERILALDALPSTVQKIIWRTPDLSHSSAPNSKDPWFHECVPFSASVSGGAWDPWGRKVPGGGKLQWIYDAVHEYAQGTRVEVMDVMGIGGQRADGRPSAHLNRTREGVPVHDCLHWCLPGVPDAWNEVLINYLCQDFLE